MNRRAVDALRVPFYSSGHPRGSLILRNQFYLGNPGCKKPCTLDLRYARLSQAEYRSRYRGSGRESGAGLKGRPGDDRPRGAGKVMAISLWETEADLRASESLRTGESDARQMEQSLNSKIQELENELRQRDELLSESEGS